MNTQKQVVRARDLTKAFDGKEVVCGIDLDVPAGGCFGLLGPNGAGKTTTLRMILGQSPVTAGTLDVLGMPVASAGREIRRRTGVVPQGDNLDPDFTVAENLTVYGRYFGLSGPVLDARIQELLSFVELTDRSGDGIRTLSGGMKRRLAIARALVNDPELIVLDEPTTGLDPQARHVIWARLRQLKSSGKTLLLTTHFMEEAERLCDDLVVIDHGRVVNQGSPRALVREQVEPDVVELHTSSPALDAELATLPGLRAETIGETRYLYTRDAAALLAQLEGHGEATYLHRPANLEDVFLKLTGRDLRD